MAVGTVKSKGIVFADLDLKFTKNPITNRLTVLKDEEAVKRSIRNLILTNRYERPYKPLIGGNITDLLFENFDSITSQDIKRNIIEVIENYEPRAEVLDVVVDVSSYNANALNISIVFRVVNRADPTTVSFQVERIR